MSHRLLYPKEEDHDSVYRLCLKKKKASNEKSVLEAAASTVKHVRKLYMCCC